MKETRKVELYFQIKGGKIEFFRRDWQSQVLDLAKNNDGLAGTATFQIDIAKTLKQLRFFHGPLLDWFCECSGMPKTKRNKGWLKKHLKRQFVSEKRSSEELATIARMKGGEITEDDEWFDPSLKDFSKTKMIQFINDSVEYLGEWGLSMDRRQYVEYMEAIEEDTSQLPLSVAS